MDLKRGDPVTVFWLDTYAEVNWHSADEIEDLKPTLVEVRGFFISQDDECIRIAGSKQHNNQLDFSSIDIIPKGAIRSIDSYAKHNTTDAPQA